MRKALHTFRAKGAASEIETAVAMINGQANAQTALGSHGPIRRKMGRQLFHKLRRLRRDDPSLEVRSVTIILERYNTSDEKTCLDLRGLVTEARRILKSIGPNFLAVCEIQPTANIPHLKGGKTIFFHVHGVIIGQELFDVADVVASRTNDRLGLTSTGLVPVYVSEPCREDLQLERACRYLFKLPSKQKTHYLNPETGKQNLHESEKGDRYIRFERILELLSSLKLRDLVFAGGYLRDIKTTALHESASACRGTSCLPNINLRKFWKTWRKETGTKRFRKPQIRGR
jgi:hypothetical protein